MSSANSATFSNSNTLGFLTESELETHLLAFPEFKDFWESPTPVMLIRGRPTAQDPVFEIQLAWDLGDRLETYAWVWLDALEGHMINRL